MALYTIGDLHLSLGGSKPMDIFGDKWANHVERLRESFSHLTADDVTVLAGDLSGAFRSRSRCRTFSSSTRCPDARSF